MIKRIYEPLDKFLQKGKALIIYGPRQVGKTTLLQKFLKTTNKKYKLDSGDNIKTQNILSSQDFSQILNYVEGYDLIAIDEAQNIPNIGMGLKIIIDNKPNISIIATGSSSFDLANKVGEPLTGRKKTITLYPVSQIELLDTHNKHELQERLEEFLIFGSYPEVVTARTQKQKIELLKELVNSYLLKDILDMEKVKGSKVLLDMLKLLAFQVGNQVSLHELATQLSIDVKTVARYLDLLEKTFVIKRLTGFSRNLRNEITSKHKYYFLDNGIRNAVISQFNNIADRADVGALFENFVMMERVKKLEYKNDYSLIYFWRNYAGNEIDLVEEKDGKLKAYEFKWNPGKKIKAPNEWTKSYPQASFKTVTSQDYLKFVT